MKNQQGFTLIELVVVIVILGILAAVAVPKFIDMRAEASQAAAEGIAGAAGSAMAINYAGCSVANNVPADGKCVEINLPAASIGDASAIVALVLQDGWPAGYTVACTDAATANGNTSTCTVKNSDDNLTIDPTFTLIAAGI